MPLFLKSEAVPTLPGLTMFSDPLLGTWAKPTGVYLPPSVDIDSGVINVLLWLHGWYVPRIEHLFYNDRSAVRQQVLKSGKSVVLVAPYLGNGFDGAGSTFSGADLKGHWGELFLNQVINTLALARDPATYDPPWERSTMSLMHLNTKPGLRLGKLVIACHSGGGSGMRNLVGALGRYKANLAACWGFDCLYGVNAAPDDASFWYDWVTGSNGRPLHISYGRSTVAQSAKLYLMGRGVAARDGSIRNPAGPEVARLDVSLGISTPHSIDDLMGLDSLRPATTPNARRPPAPARKFVDQAAVNLKQKAGWPADLMEMHYAIAKDGLLERLSGADFL